ncbi:MAG TPA: cardiolipin synthase [Candidatus Bathyarchaeia archaeon]|nr:cardiolipin synthase [Candidatus Bathyarchaeia archaeon]
MTITDLVLIAVLVSDLLFAITIVFFERKSPATVWAWLLVLFFLPVVGFVLYVFLGQNYRKKKMFRMKQDADAAAFRRLVEVQKSELKASDIAATEHLSAAFRRMVLMLIEDNGSILTTNNQIKVYTDGNEKFSDLIAAIKEAHDHVHLEYYIWRNDALGREIRESLAERARAGVDVKLLCDGLGCARLPIHFFDELRRAGGQVAFFFPSLVRSVNLRSNFRNHRKIAVIDGKIGFVGGFNIGDEYLGKVRKWGYWRDAAVRIAGSAVSLCQLRFFFDWNYATKGRHLDYEHRYFPDSSPSDGACVQIVSGGPDTYWNPIKESYLKMINTATDTIYIQTPYFVPDDSVRDALRIAALSGLDVRIMIPNRPDHPFVYWAGLSFIGQLLGSGVRAYTYGNGFLHAKTIVVDEVVASVGSANWDLRSFGLNFETNAIIYDTPVARGLKDAFARDLDVCTELTPERYANRSTTIKLKESISRLFSALL